MEQAFKQFAAATNNELFDADYKGGEWMVQAVETHETIDQFVESARSYAEIKSTKRGEIAGVQFVTFRGAQPVKGQSRRDISVIDLGSVRIALDGTDLTNFS